ncbi:MAG: membrane-bound O-acyltransferase family protein [Candidatus Endolissoclinum sp. TMED37]|nr:MAG: membrane-bound O-acyltransferase family protein [Candidatus Endolissoclinum sp. TMED37]
MNFNSILFLTFFAFVFTIHWTFFSKSNKFQNSFLLISSLLFYAGWDYRFLALILFSTIIDFYLGIVIEKSSDKKQKKNLLLLSLISNLGLLFIFKYFNFFLESFLTVSSLIGFQPNVRLLNIVLPVGISFYTFQTLSYSIDVYQGKIRATKDWILFASYVTFFPQLVAGPIERASRILPQLSKKRNFEWNQGKEGIRKIILGFFKKVVIADSLAPMVEYSFTNYQDLSSFALLLGALYFTIQIYCDFSGYSDIAIGISKLFGINLMENFKFPYFAKNIGEFWRRWHISLTTWFRDYLYIPLGGSRGSLLFSFRNITIVFLVSGFWHGANWTFIFWGLIHVMYYVHYFLRKKNPKSIFLSSLIIKNRILAVITTFVLVMLSWVFFRSNTIEEAWLYLFRLFSMAEGQHIFLNPANNLNAAYYLIYILFFLFIDNYISLEKKETDLQRRLLNSGLLLIILFFVQMDQAESFIYFQF